MSEAPQDNEVLSAENAKPPGRRWLRRLALAGIVFALLLVAATVAFLALRAHDKAAFRRAVEEIRDRGEPVTALECEPDPVPIEEDGGPLLRAAMGAMPDLPEGASPDEFWGLCSGEDDNGWNGDPRTFKNHIVKAQQLLDLHAEALGLFDRALVKPRFRLSIDYAKGHEDPGKIFLYIGEFHMLLEIRILLAAIQGRTEEALEDVKNLLRLGEAVGGEGPVVYFIVSSCHQSYASSSLEKLLRLQTPSKAQLRAMALRFSSAEDHLDIRRALRVERAFTLEIFRPLFEDSLPEDKSWEPIPGLLPGRDGLRYLKGMERILDATEQTFLKARQSVEDIGGTSAWTPVSSLLLPNAITVVDTRFRWKVMLRMAALSCRILLEKNGSAFRWEAVEAALEKNRPDPFTGEPFRVLEGPEGMLIVSPGHDLIYEHDFTARTVSGFATGEMDVEEDDLTFFVPWTEHEGDGGN